MLRSFQSGTVHHQKDEFLNAASLLHSATEEHVRSADERWAASIAPECDGVNWLLCVFSSPGVFPYEAATQRHNAVADSLFPPLIAFWRNGRFRRSTQPGQILLLHGKAARISAMSSTNRRFKQRCREPFSSSQAGKEPLSTSRFFVTIASPFFVDTSIPVAQTVRHSSIRPSLNSDWAQA